MKRPRLGPRDRRALRLGAWIAAPALFIVLVVRPYQRALRSASDELASQRALLARELGAVRAAPRDAELAALGRRALADERSRLFAGADAVAASAQLASYVAQYASQSGVEIEESETLVLPDSATFAGAEIAAAGNVLEVVEFLRALEEGPRLARTERIVLAPALGGGREDGTLTLRMTVTSVSYRGDDTTAERMVAHSPEDQR